MKTMKLGNELPIRVKETDVDRKLAAGYKFCPRSEWKRLVRDSDKAEKKENIEDADASAKPKKEKKTKK